MHALIDKYIYFYIYMYIYIFFLPPPHDLASVGLGFAWGAHVVRKLLQA